MADLASRLAESMKSARLNQPQLAKAASAPKQAVSQQVVQHLLARRNKTSKHLPAIARALGVSLEWLISGPISAAKWEEGSKPVLVGTVGSDGAVSAFPYGIPASDPALFFDLRRSNVLRVKGMGSAVLRDGWLVFYETEDRGVGQGCLNRLCVVQVSQGGRLLRILRRSKHKGLYRLESLDGGKQRDVKIVWAAPMICIRP